MSYVDELNIVWLTPMRTASRSSLSLLSYCETFVNRGHNLTFPKDKIDYSLIFNIRNPLPRVVSIYWLWCLHHRNYKKIFKDWLFNYKKWQSSYQLHLDNFVLSLPKNPNYYVRTEFFNEDLMKIEPIKDYFISLGTIYDEQVLYNGYQHYSVPASGKIKFPWYSEYDEESAQFVNNLCKRQFEMFNYNPNYWKDGTP